MLASSFVSPEKTFACDVVYFHGYLWDLYACIRKACLSLRNVRNEECEIVCAMGCVFIEWRPKNIMFSYNNEGVETKLIKKCHRYVPLIHISNLLIFQHDNLGFLFWYHRLNDFPLQSYPNHMISAYRIIIARWRKTFCVSFGQLILEGHKMIKDSFILWQAPKKFLKLLRKGT